MKNDPLPKLRKICLAFPGAYEKLSHGEPAWFAPKRMFAMFANNHHGDGRIAVWCNATFDEQETLVAADPEHFFVPPYVGPSGWLGIRVDRGLDWGMVATLLKQAYDLSAAPRKARRSV